MFQQVSTDNRRSVVEHENNSRFSVVHRNMGKAGKEKKANKSRMRGLILRPEFAESFFRLHPNTGTTKTLELRSYNCRCVSIGERFHIVACQQGRNKHGVTVMKVVGSVVFQGNEKITHDSVASRYSEHLCSDKEYQVFVKKWSKDHCIGWKVAESLPMLPPKWIQSNHQEP